MKFYSMFMISALVCGSMVSCIDDEESDEVKAIREVELAKEKVELAQSEVSLANSQASLDRTYRSIYNDAVSSVKSLEADAKDIQLQLDDAKTSTAYYENVKTAITEWNQNRIAFNEAQIKLEEAKIAVYEKAKENVITSDELSEETLNAQIEYKKEYAEYVAAWQKVVDANYNLNYSGTYYWIKDAISSQIKVLVGSEYNYSSPSYYIPVNHDLYNSDYALAVKEVFTNGSDYRFYDSYRDGASYNNYNLYDAFELTEAKLLYNDNSFINYSYYGSFDATDYLAALQANIDTLTNRVNRGLDYYESSLEDYKEIQTKAKAVVETITKSLDDYTKLLATLETYAKDVYTSYQEYQYAYSVYAAYDALSGMSIENLVISAQENIYNYKNSIANYNSNIENAANNVTDNATLISYYTTVLAQIKNDIKVQQAIADKYGKLLGATSAAATTTAE